MKIAAIILAAGLLSASAAAHAQSIAPGAAGAPQAGLPPADLTAIMQSMQQTMPKMDGAALEVMLAEISAKMKAQSDMASKQLDVARTDPTTSSPDAKQAQLELLQRLQAQTNASKDMLAAKKDLLEKPQATAPAAPTLPPGMTQAQYQRLMRAQEAEASDLQKTLSQPVMGILNPAIIAGVLSMQKARTEQDAVVRPSPQQEQARQQLDIMLKQGVRTDQQRQQVMQLFKQGQWQMPSAPQVALTQQQQAQLAAMVTPQHQALLTALTQAQSQLAAARDKQAAAQKRLMTLQSQIGPGNIVSIAPQIVQAQREIIDMNPVIAAAQQNVTRATQQAAPALQAVSQQAALAAQMRAQRAAMTPAQLAQEKLQLEREAALLRKEQLKAAQTQLPITQAQLKEAQEQVAVRQKAAAAQVADMKTQHAQQLATAQARIDALQKQSPSTPGLQQQMQAAGQAMGGLQRQQAQQLQGMQQAHYQNEQSQQKQIASLQQMVASLQQQINALQGQQAQASATPVSPEMQKILDSMTTASTTQIDQIMQALLAQTNTMTAAMNSASQMRP